MRLNIKRGMAVIMSAFMFFQNGVYGAAKESKNGVVSSCISFGQKIKWGFNAFKDKIRKNPKTSAAVGGGIGLVAILSLILARVCKGKKANNKPKKKELGSAKKTGGEPAKPQSVADSLKPIPVAKPVLPLVSELGSSSEPIQESKSDLTPQLEVTHEYEPISVAPVNAGLGAGSDEDGEDDPKISVGTSSFVEESSETHKGDDADLDVPLGGDQNGGSVPGNSPQGEIKLPGAAGDQTAPHKPTSPTDSRSPSPMGEELVVDEELQIEFSEEAEKKVLCFCRVPNPCGDLKPLGEDKKEAVYDLIRFFGKIKNDSHDKSKDYASLLETNAVRCWRNSNKTANKTRKIKKGALKEFGELAEACNFRFGTKGELQKNVYWDSFLSNFLHNLVIVENASGGNQQTVKLRSEPLRKGEVVVG